MIVIFIYMNLKETIRRILIEQVNQTATSNTSVYDALQNSQKRKMVKTPLVLQVNPVLQKYLSAKPELIPLYQDIERILNDKFTEDHFKAEIKYSGGLKELNPNNNMDPKTVEKFNQMKTVAPTISIRDNSFRDYNKQKEVFLKYAKKFGGISGGLRQAALPGYSQHHTGKAIDVGNYRTINQNIINKYGFKFPYPTDTGFRMAEPWHIIDIS